MPFTKSIFSLKFTIDFIDKPHFTETFNLFFSSFQALKQKYSDCCRNTRVALRIPNRTRPLWNAGVPHPRITCYRPPLGIKHYNLPNHPKHRIENPKIPSPFYQNLLRNAPYCLRDVSTCHGGDTDGTRSKLIIERLNRATIVVHPYYLSCYCFCLLIHFRLHRFMTSFNTLPLSDRKFIFTAFVTLPFAPRKKS